MRPLTSIGLNTASLEVTSAVRPCFGTLMGSVVTHKATAERGDGVESWDDDDTLSQVSYFSTSHRDTLRPVVARK